MTCHAHVLIVILNVARCLCFAGYELFQGFNELDVDDTADTTTDSFLHFTFEDLLTEENFQSQQKDKVTNFTTQDYNNNTILINATTPARNKTARFKCPEEERPSNLGAYEIPTQRDLVLFTKSILLDMFSSYNTDAFYLLKDIKEATKATSTTERKCQSNRLAYRKCVKRISSQCEQITKNLVMSLENQKQKISDLTEERICKLSEMDTDPIQLLKSLAQAKISLEFALPGFLRLINTCSAFCYQSATTYKNKPSRHMTDQDLVIKHFLTRKNYLELIMDSRHKTIANSN